MSGGIPFLDIILFALIAAFLVLRLRSVLGRRDGHQGPTRDPFGTSSRRDRADDNVVRLPDRSDPLADDEMAPALEDEPSDAATPMEAGLAQIKIANPQFDSNEFVSGARIAFEMVLVSFAVGDTDTLRPLLSPEVFGNFSQSILDREQAGETMETTLVGIRTAELVEAYMAGRTAHLTVKFVSEQITVVRDEAGEVIEGDPTVVTQVTDFWTFARDTRNRDPNWILVATGTLE